MGTVHLSFSTGDNVILNIMKISYFIIYVRSFISLLDRIRQILLFVFLENQLK